MVYVVIACGFSSKMQMCPTMIARLKATLEKFREGDRVIVTGAVPFGIGGPTLARLGKGWLLKKGLAPSSVSALRDGLETFSEARHVTRQLKNEKEITVVSSSWYLFNGGPIWSRRGLENGLKIKFISVPKTGGWRTKVRYGMIGTIVRIAHLLGFENMLERRVSASQEWRRGGYKSSCCA